MSTDVSEVAIEEVTAALARNVASFSAPPWVETASALIKAGGPLAAAQLAPGETVEWLTPGIVHRGGKVWPEAVLLVTPHRLIVSASRGSIRTKREISSLYRGPESLLAVTHRLLPGSSNDHWMLEIATQQGPFLFAIPNFNGSDALAQITGAFIARRAQFFPESGILLDGAPWGAQVPAQRVSSEDGHNPFEAAKADLAGAADDAQQAGPGAWTPNEPVTFAAPAEPETFAPPAEPETFAAPAEPEPFTPPAEPEPFTPPAEPETFAAPAEPETFAPPAEPETFAPPAEPETLTPQAEPETSAAEPEAGSAAPLPPADWYPDPLGEAGLRYWDGQAWTQHVAH